jgi:hypothetical protein
MRILAWNILHGGSGRRLPEIVLALLGHRPDVVVLSEFRARLGGQIRGILADHGLSHQAATPPPQTETACSSPRGCPLCREPTGR